MEKIYPSVHSAFVNRLVFIFVMIVMGLNQGIDPLLNIPANLQLPDLETNNHLCNSLYLLPSFCDGNAYT